MKRIASIQDISCLGRCSLTVALPVISALGVECAIVPTAVLSAHTAFPGFVSRDLSDQLATTAHPAPISPALTGGSRAPTTAPVTSLPPRWWAA